jgi:serine/threonine protein kinase
VTVGSYGYLAPEVLQGTHYNEPKSDVWSMGVVLFALLCGDEPFESLNPEGVKSLVLQGAVVFRCKNYFQIHEFRGTMVD